MNYVLFSLRKTGGNYFKSSQKAPHEKTLSYVKAFSGKVYANLFKLWSPEVGLCHNVRSNISVREKKLVWKHPGSVGSSVQVCSYYDPKGTYQAAKMG